MLTKKLCGVLVAVAAIGLSAQSAVAQTRVVGSLKDVTTGKELCQPGIAKQFRFTKIQAAVDDAIAGHYPSTIYVCPGRYPEQVRIYDSADYEPIITLKGSNLTAGPAVITVPATPWTFFQSVNYGPVAAQLLVTDTKGVTVNNIEVDGSGGCPTIPGAATKPMLAGIMFANTGDPLSSTTEAGTIRWVHVHDQLPNFTPATCGMSAGIIADNAYIVINDNNIHNVNYSGIAEYGGNALMLRNKISFPGYTAIRSTAANPIDVSANMISNTYIGILLENGTNQVQVDKNSFSPFVTTAIWLHGASNNYLRGNTITNAWTGILLDGLFPQGAPSWPSMGNLVEGNVVTNCGNACIQDQVSGGTNRIDANTLKNSAAVGIWLWFVADFLENGTAPAPPPAPFADWDSIYDNIYTNIPVHICHASFVSGAWVCAAGDQ